MTLHFTAEILAADWRDTLGCPVYLALTAARPDLEFFCGYSYFLWRPRGVGEFKQRLMPQELRTLQDRLGNGWPVEPFTYAMQELP
jgi:hypothetical protein